MLSISRKMKMSLVFYDEIQLIPEVNVLKIVLRKSSASAHHTMRHEITPLSKYDIDSAIMFTMSP